MLDRVTVHTSYCCCTALRTRYLLQQMCSTMKRKTMWPFKRKRQRTEESKPILDDNMVDDHTGNTDTKKASNTPPDTEDPHCSEMQLVFDNNNNSFKRKLICHMQESLNKHYPRLPTGGDMTLEKHLSIVQETIVNELQKLAPQFTQNNKLLGCLIECYHRHTCDHLHSLLSHVTSTKEGFTLLDWVLHTYLSDDFLGHTGIQVLDLRKYLDLLLLTDWTLQAQDKLLGNLQRDMCRSLERILQDEDADRNTDLSADDEAFVKLYVDVIQCTNANLKRAEEISPTLMGKVKTVCFQELHKFVKRYIIAETKNLEKQTKMSLTGAMHLIKTLKTCKELKLYVQDHGNGVQHYPYEETLSVLEDMETFSSKVLMETLGGTAENFLKTYFKRDDKQILILIDTMKQLFNKVPNNLDQYKRIVDETYQNICHVYLRHLVQSNQRKLEKTWNNDVGIRVNQDAVLLHSTFSDLNPDVGQWNLTLLKVKELLDSKDKNTLSLTVAEILSESHQTKADVELLTELLRWRGGLSRRWITIHTCLPDDQTKPTARFQWLLCC